MSTLPGVVEHYKPTTFRHLNLTGEEFFSKIKKPPFKEFYYFTSEIDDIGDIKHDLYPIEPLIVLVHFHKRKILYLIFVF